MTFILWCILFVLCWPLALMALFCIRLSGCCCFPSVFSALR